MVFSKIYACGSSDVMIDKFDNFYTLQVYPYYPSTLQKFRSEFFGQDFRFYLWSAILDV